MTLLRSQNRESSHHVVQIDEGVVDGNHLDLASGGGGAGHQTADTSKSGRREDKMSSEKSSSMLICEVSFWFNLLRPASFNENETPAAVPLSGQQVELTPKLGWGSHGLPTLTVTVDGSQASVCA